MQAGTLSNLWPSLDLVLGEIRSIGDIKAFALVRRDGVVVSHCLGDDSDPKMVAVTTAAILATAEMATEQLRQGRFIRTIVECEHGKILLSDAGEQTLLVSLVFSDANLGFVLMSLEKVGKKVAEIIDGRCNKVQRLQ